MPLTVNTGSIANVLKSIAITGPLAVGSRGPDVRKVQEALNRMTPSPCLDVDGAFGLKTDAAVRAFQRLHGLKRDGIVGPRTSAALNLLYTPRISVLPPMPHSPPSGRQHGPFEIPVLPSVPQSDTLIEQLVSAVIQGLSEVQNGVLRILSALDILPDSILGEVRSLLANPVQAAIATLRNCVTMVRANIASAANIVSSSVRGAFQKVINALQAALGVLSRLPDLLGLSGVANQIRSLISKLQRSVDGVIDSMLRTLSGIGHSILDAIAAILGILRDAAAVAA